MKTFPTKVIRPAYEFEVPHVCIPFVARFHRIRKGLSLSTLASMCRGSISAANLKAMEDGRFVPSPMVWGTLVRLLD